MREIRVPKVGMSGLEVEVTEVLVTPGQHVEPGTPLVEAAADKVDFTIDAEVAGVVTEILPGVGDVVEVGQVVVRLEESA